MPATSASRFPRRPGRTPRSALATLFCATALIGAAPLNPGVAHAKQDRNPSCTDHSIPVADGHQQLHGQLCTPAEDTARPPTIQVLVPGAAHNASYWNFPRDPETYSFARAMNRAGYATLALDPLGTGTSSKPPAPTVTTAAQSSAVHQVIRGLRAGAIGPTAYQKVIVGGHSLGSLDAMLEASTYHDVDGVLLSGMSHHLNTTGLLRFFGSMHPAMFDPLLARSNRDPGYLTTRPGARADTFYNPDGVDPRVAETDERTKDVFSPAEADNILVATLPLTRSINVPTFSAVGRRDSISCGPVTRRICRDAASFRDAESPHYSPNAHLRTQVLPGSGHSMNLSPNTEEFQNAAIEWADEWVGSPAAATSSTIPP